MLRFYLTETTMDLSVTKEIKLNKAGWICGGMVESFKEATDTSGSKGLKVRYLAIPFGSDGNSLISRNRAAYSGESIRNTLEMWKGLPVNVNHQIDEPGVEGLAVGHVEDAFITEKGLYLDLFIDACETKVIEKIKSGTARSCSIQVVAASATEMESNDGQTFQFVDVREPLEISLVNVPGFRGATMEAILSEAFKAVSENETTNNNSDVINTVIPNKKMETPDMQDKPKPEGDIQNDVDAKANGNETGSVTERLEKLESSINGMSGTMEKLEAFLSSKENVESDESEEQPTAPVSNPADETGEDSTMEKMVEIVSTLAEEVAAIKAQMNSDGSEEPATPVEEEPAKPAEGEEIPEDQKSEENVDEEKPVDETPKEEMDPEKDEPIAKESYDAKAIFRSENTTQKENFANAVSLII